MKISRVGVDLAKSVFQLHGADAHGKAVWKRKLSRRKWVESLCNTAPVGCEVGMEACASAHHWARLLTQHGYQVKLIPPQFVTPYVKSNNIIVLFCASCRVVHTIINRRMNVSCFLLLYVLDIVKYFILITCWAVYV